MADRPSFKIVTVLLIVQATQGWQAYAPAPAWCPFLKRGMSTAYSERIIARLFVACFYLSLLLYPVTHSSSLLSRKSFQKLSGIASALLAIFPLVHLAQRES